MSAQRLVRLKAEMTMMARSPVPGIHCWLKENTADVLVVEMDGPAGSPYEKGVFELEVTLSERYPFTPPNIRFITPVYHPNIDPQGRICLTALKPKPAGTWAVNLNIATVLGAIRILLAEPNLADPLMSDIAKEYGENHEMFRKHAEEETLKNAKRIKCEMPVPRSSSEGKKEMECLHDDVKENESDNDNEKSSRGSKSKSDEDLPENIAKKPRLS